MKNFVAKKKKEGVFFHKRQARQATRSVAGLCFPPPSGGKQGPPHFFPRTAHEAPTSCPGHPTNRPLFPPSPPAPTDPVPLAPRFAFRPCASSAPELLPPATAKDIAAIALRRGQTGKGIME